MLISLIHPSRGRASKAYYTLKDWVSKSTSPVEHILSLDSDDPELELYKDIFGNDLSLNTQIIINSNTCVVEASNCAAKVATGDILIYLSDDFNCPYNWDDLIVEEFSQASMIHPCVLKVDDCLQKFEVRVLTIPVMNRALYGTLGYFWHSEYKSMFVDEDLFWTCHINNWIKYASQLRFEHHHPANGKAKNDDTYSRSSANWDQGKATFAKRKALNFPL